MYVVTGDAFLDMCVELFYVDPLSVLSGEGVDPPDLNGLEHAGMVLIDSPDADARVECGSGGALERAEMIADFLAV
ncbi:hypothetical protein HU200_048901 [Digitaria exilis]|uniref:Uncharacterized protein n=1 Tax=Digitaria exilis TaxID=1010633 RepID=A0A835AUY0_9POAL|nr:hypothetical protein HU200_048901 [Digitaria exilis]